jgi:hypothetical protein
LIAFTGISSNRWTSLFILIGSGNLYPALNDAVVGTCIDPNISTKVTSEHYLEEPWMLDYFFLLGKSYLLIGQEDMFMLLGF